MAPFIGEPYGLNEDSPLSHMMFRTAQSRAIENCCDCRKIKFEVALNFFDETISAEPSPAGNVSPVSLKHLALTKTLNQPKKLNYKFFEYIDQNIIPLNQLYGAVFKINAPFGKMVTLEELNQYTREDSQYKMFELELLLEAAEPRARLMATCRCMYHTQMELHNNNGYPRFVRFKNQHESLLPGNQHISTCEKINKV